MGATTAISWTDHTFNPWWGCERVSPGCNHCYAETFAKRVGQDVWGKTSPRRFFGDKHWLEPEKWNRAAEAEGRRHRVFCASMADVFEDRDELVPHRDRLFRLIEATPWLDWQLLTKRPQNILVMLPRRWLLDFPGNVWLGTTVEDQERAYDRLDWLEEIRQAPVLFLSCEPLLGPVDLSRWIPGRFFRPAVNWVIVGGESGGHHRPLNLEHARSIRDLCVNEGVAFFFKQVGGRTPTAGGDLLDGVQWKQFPERRRRAENTAAL